jgi:hypothetical protein
MFYREPGVEQNRKNYEFHDLRITILYFKLNYSVFSNGQSLYIGLTSKMFTYVRLSRKGQSM